MALATARLSNYRQAPRKVRLVADSIRGKSVPEALALLALQPKRASLPLAKLLRSAASQAKERGENPDTLFISRITVDKGIVLRRFMPRARGSSSPILKRSSHVVIDLDAQKQSAKKRRTRGADPKGLAKEAPPAA